MASLFRIFNSVEIWQWINNFSSAYYVDVVIGNITIMIIFASGSTAPLQSYV